MERRDRERAVPGHGVRVLCGAVLRGVEAMRRRGRKIRRAGNDRLRFERSTAPAEFGHVTTTLPRTVGEEGEVAGSSLKTTRPPSLVTCVLGEEARRPARARGRRAELVPTLLDRATGRRVLARENGSLHGRLVLLGEGEELLGDAVLRLLARLAVRVGDGAHDEEVVAHEVLRRKGSAALACMTR
mgnify:CR=1 FL=1